ncbi:MAG: putative immunity protein [Bacilli bacterium]
MEKKVDSRKEMIFVAINSVEHILWILDNYYAQRQVVLSLLKEVYNWYYNQISIKKARSFGFLAHDYARKEDIKFIKLIYRGVGHTLATAHVKKHGLIALDYCLKAVREFTKEQIIINHELDFQKSLLSKLCL